MLAQLAVFRSGFTREAALSLLQLPNHAAAPLRHLAALVRKSLLQFDVANDHYFMHELMRQYSAEKLRQQPAEDAAAHDRHSAFYCAWLHQREADLKGAREQAALAEIETEYSNIRSAWAWAVAQDYGERIAQAGDAYALFADYRGNYLEAEEAFASAVRQLQSTGHESPDEEATLRTIAGLLTWQAFFIRRQGRSTQATERLQQSLSILENSDLAATDTRKERAALLRNMAVLAYPYGQDREKARYLYRQALALYQALDDPWGMANVLEFLGELETYVGNLAEALRLQEKCLALRQGIGNLRSVANSLHQVAVILQFQGDWAKAEQLMRQSLAIHQQINDGPGVAQRLTTLSWTLIVAGKLSEAETLARQSLWLHHQLGDRFFMSLAYLNLVGSKFHLGHYAQAQHLAQENLQVQQEQDANHGIYLMTLCWAQIACQQYQAALQVIDKVQMLMSEGDFDVQPFQIERALAVIEYHLGHLRQSQQHVMNALALVGQNQWLYSVIEVILSSLPIIALAEKKERVLELCGLAGSYPLFTQSQWYQDSVWTPLATLGVAITPAEVEAASTQVQRLNPWETASRLMQDLLDMGWPPAEAPVKMKEQEVGRSVASHNKK
jgi:tetratricopeptide (TPR) repeat protein